ncbi:phosphatase PAP2 family protein [Texcoconibacillus texcoconensis]|nr:phosphatase PAP2 family protein [Texcoconibacillus texcoconensis]
MDHQLFHWLHGFSNQYDWLDAVMMAMTEHGPTFFALSLVVVFIYHLVKNHWQNTFATFTVAGLSMGATVGIGFLIKELYYRDRPFITYELELLITHNEASSFPSNHTLAAFAIAFAIFYVYRKLGVAYLVLAALMGLSRIYLGHHYPVDVISAAVIAVVVASVLLKVRYEETILRFLEKMKASRDSA